MAFYDRVRFKPSNAPGTGAITVGTAETGFRTPAGASIPNSTALTLMAEDGAAWEIFESVYTTSGTSCSRGTLIDSSSGSRLSLSATAIISVIASARQIIDKNSTSGDTMLGPLTAPRFIPSGSTVPTNGLYLPASNTLGWAINSAGEVQLTASALSPMVSDGNALGTSSLMWADLFLASGGVINWNNGNVTLTHSSGLLTLSGALSVTGGTTFGTPTITLPGSQQTIMLGDRGILQSWPSDALGGSYFMHNAWHHGGVGWKNIANAALSMIKAAAGTVDIYVNASPGAAGTSFTPTLRAQFTDQGLGLGISSPTCMLDINSDKFRVRTAKTPASASATGNAGDICWDASYIYVCTSTNTWQRTAHATW